MKIRAIALNTLAGLVRNRLIILFLAIFVCVLLLMMTPLMAMKAMAAAQGAEQARSMVLSFTGMIMSLVSGFGSLLAAWAAADAVASEVRSGTIQALMARPVARWEFLLGKFLGVQMLMAAYVLFMFALSYLLVWIGGERIHSAPWPLIVYPLVRYAVYSGIGMLLVMAMHPVVAFGAVLVISVVTAMVSPGYQRFLPGWLANTLYVVLPSTGLLSESRFLMITDATLNPIRWSDHLIILTYGLDYALVLFLLAAWCFRHRSLN